MEIFNTKPGDALINSVFWTPAQAGVQKNQVIIVSHLRGNDINQSFPGPDIAPVAGGKVSPRLNALPSHSITSRF